MSNLRPSSCTEVPTARGIVDYRLVVAQDDMELAAEVRKLVDEGCSVLGSSAYLRRDGQTSRAVFIQPMVVFASEKP